MARPAAKLILTEEEHADILLLVKGMKVEHRLRQRAQIILDWKE